ncbi:universal stress protein [Falsiroseomonas sp. HC035]|uniref:universal stress protein n=1 Tax=Falsiroseomonas sp. HC035 TaxID=3390999 RepID=UPI003D31058A
MAQFTTVQRHGALVDTIMEFEGAADLMLVGKQNGAANFAVGHLGARRCCTGMRHGRLRNMIVGSTTTALLRSCKIPVLVFR